MRSFSCFLTVGVFVATAFGTGVAVVANAYHQGALQVCSLVGQHYFRRNEPRVQKFLESCFREAESEPFLISLDANIERINRRLETLGSSHLSLYNPMENRQMWDNEGLDTGIRSRFVDEFLVVYKVLPGSPASKAGIKPGDILSRLNGGIVSSPSRARTGWGRFVISRDQKTLAIDVQPVGLVEDMTPTLEDLEDGVGILRLPSFLAQYYDEGKWARIAERLSRFKKLVIDVRENAGGSFPAMLRAASPFFCNQELIGAIHQPRREGMKAAVVMHDDLRASSQLKQLEESAQVELRAFKTYGCFNGEVTVLLDGGTSSVAEIFAQAFYSRPRSRVWGQPSAGQVVMAQWFPVATFGSEEFSLAVPIAGVRTAGGVELESQGLSPQRMLYYDLERSLKGRDPWIEDAVSM